MNLTQFLNRDVKIRSRRMYSPSLKNVGWIEDAQLIFLVFHIFTCNVFPATPLLPCQIYRQMYGKLEKLIERVLANLHSSNLVSTTLGSLLSILTLQFLNYVKFNFGKSYLPSDSNTNTVISSALPTVKTAPKTGKRQTHVTTWPIALAAHFSLAASSRSRLYMFRWLHSSLNIAASPVRIFFCIY